MDISNKMGTEPMKKLAFRISTPMVISMISLALYGIIDTMFISQIGNDSLKASSLSIPIQSIITAIALGLGIGLNSFLAKTLGEKNEEKAQSIIKNGLSLTLISWIIVAIICFWGTEKFLSFFTDNFNVLEQGKAYLGIIGTISIGTFYQIIFEKILEAYGKAKSSMIVQFSGAIINLILDPILIFGYLGLPELGIKGAAISTVIGQCTGMMIGIVILIKSKIINFVDLFKIKFEKDICLEIYKVGFPTTIKEAVSSFITLILNKILAGFSEDAIAVWGVYSQLQKFVIIIVYGFNYGMIPILAYNYGAKNKNRIKECIKIFLKISIIVTLIGQLVFLIFTRQLIQIYDNSGELLYIALTAFRILSIGFVFAGISLVISAIFQAFGNGIYSLIVNLSRQLIVTLPLIWILKSFIGLNGIWIAFSLAELITMIISICLYKKYKNKLKEEKIEI